MSNLESKCDASVSSDCPAPAAEPATLHIATRDAVLGDGMTIRRALPSRLRRMIGAWCFLDHFGPVDVSGGRGLRVGPHPHTGLQTFTWPMQGEILHRDSLGYTQIIRPGQVNLMTAGRGIAHSEESPLQRPPGLQGAQLWIALPSSERFRDPAFEHYPELPVLDRDGFRMTVLAGLCLGEQAPSRVYTPLSAVDLTTPGDAATHLPLEPGFEYGAIVLEGVMELAGERLGVGTLLYLGSGREHLAVRATGAARLMLIGGEPFAEEVLLWWNFVARSRQEILQATDDWNAGRHFGEVRGYDGERLVAPLPPWAHV